MYVGEIIGGLIFYIILNIAMYSLDNKFRFWRITIYNVILFIASLSYIILMFYKIKVKKNNVINN